MKPSTRSDETLMLTLACGSPGSAWAYHHIADQDSPSDGPNMVRCTIAPSQEPAAAVTRPQQPAEPGAISWIGKLWRRLEQWSWERQLRRDEAYLAQAQNPADLEARMRRLDGDWYSRARALH